MRLIMMGTGPFAVPTFRALYDTPHEVLGLVTQPLRSGPARRPVPTPMRDVAAEHGTPVFDPEDVNTEPAQAQLRDLRPDLLIVADYGQILAPATLGTARLGGINLHGSLLPKYRGAAPINWAIYRGERTAGVTVIHMSPRIDAGPTLAQAATEIGPEETAPELEIRLAELGGPLICRTIEQLAAGQVEPIPQDAGLASPARRLRKTDGEVDWSRAASAIRNQIRALEPWPRTSTNWLRPGAAPLRLILGPAHEVPAGEHQSAEPGTVVVATGGELVIATGGGWLRLEAVQPAGKRLLSAADFLRGYPLASGDRLGPAIG
ncbi:MAG TPA: methionyl-tRNA formyltransferase [Pirellulales bacterium]|jgi:methionyl-tRNA formyltransferase|nr:methionyl-tRNA formyltransferase [Pirellulales bacterium]